MISKKKAGDDEIDVGLLIKSLTSKWHYFLISGLLCIVAAFIYIHYSLPVYQAKGSVLIKDNKSTSKDITDFIAGGFLGDQTSVATEMGILSSQTVIKQAIKKLNLQNFVEDEGVFPNVPLYKKSSVEIIADSISPLALDIPFTISISDANGFIVSFDGINNFNYNKSHRFGEKINTPYFSFTVNKTTVTSSMNKLRVTFKSNAKLVEEIQENLKVNTIDRDASIIALTYNDNDAQRALDIINTICEKYIEMDVNDKTAIASLTLKFVEEQLTSTKNTLAEIETKLQAFKEQNKTVNLSEESKNILARLSDIDADKIKSDIQVKSLDNLYNYVNQNKDLSQLAPGTLGIPDPLLVQLIQSYQELQSKRKNLEAGTKGETPALTIIDKQITSTKKSLLENISSLKSNSQVTANSLSSKMSEYESKIKSVPEIERELLNIQRDFEVNQNIYVFLLQKKAESSIAKATAVSDNKVLDEASLETEPVAPDKKLILVVALLFAVIIPSIIILLQKLFKQTINGRDDITNHTQLPVLGAIGHMKKADNLVVTHNPKSIIAEAFRSIRTNLKFFGIANNKKIILITSSVGGEGKSFVTLNLASVFALQNHKVAVVGLDLRKPRLYQDLEVSNDLGVSSYLSGQATLDQIVHKTPVSNLFLVPAGPVPPNPSELISKKELTELVKSLSEKFDYVFIDTAPLGIVSDALILMNLSDINIFILREDYSKREYIHAINDLVSESKINNLCVLLNDSSFNKSYGYGYGYSMNGYGYYEEEQNKKGIFSVFKN
ncbi:MAG TPA: polysaccharide biosynthesis tyrosine autokinase [Bacteroidia bacterium]|nr:polysaccharide biosynthesis tyrosine autokinase [Bacteroidia bacterium]HNU33845.1 polysaccharide biosynthesis tyrosine autokinase [Bacteroidia bacterium]